MKKKVIDWVLGLAAFAVGVGLTMCVVSIYSTVGKVGTVNGVAVSKAEVKDYIQTRMNGLVLDYIEDKIHLDALAELGITVAESDVQKEMDSIVEEKGGYDKFTEELEMAGSSIEQYRYNIHKILLSRKAEEYFANKAEVTDEDINKYISENYKDDKVVGTMDVRTYKIDAKNSEEAKSKIEGKKIDDFDKKDIIEEKNLSITTAFNEIPEVGTEKYVEYGGDRMLIHVDAVHGKESTEFREYVKELLKTDKGSEDYQGYIQDKTENAEIMLK